MYLDHGRVTNKHADCEHRVLHSFIYELYPLGSVEDFCGVVRYKTVLDFNRLLVVWHFSYRPTSMFSKGKRSHNYGIDEKGFGQDICLLVCASACHTPTRPNLFLYHYIYTHTSLFRLASE